MRMSKVISKVVRIVESHIYSLRIIRNESKYSQEELISILESVMDEVRAIKDDN